MNRKQPTPPWRSLWNADPDTPWEERWVSPHIPGVGRFVRGAWLLVILAALVVGGVLVGLELEERMQSRRGMALPGSVLSAPLPAETRCADLAEAGELAEGARCVVVDVRRAAEPELPVYTWDGEVLGSDQLVSRLSVEGGPALVLVRPEAGARFADVVLVFEAARAAEDAEPRVLVTNPVQAPSTM